MADLKISEFTGYTPPLDADVLPVVDTSAGATKKVTWANIKATLKTYFDTLYGAVTTVSVATANGVSGSVANPTTTPAITLTLGAITPSSVAATGTVTGSNLSGTNTGDNTVATALTGTPSITVATVTTTGNIELGHASDTTLSRSSAGVMAVEGVAVPTISSTSTLTNKRITKRVTTTDAPGATPTTNTDNGDIFEFTGLNTAITSMTTNLSGTPVNGDIIEFLFLDDGTARAITWGASFANGGLNNLPTTTVISTALRVLVQYQTAASLNKWVCVGNA